jgi:hypothetical protein
LKVFAGFDAYGPLDSEGRGGADDCHFPAGSRVVQMRRRDVDESKHLFRQTEPAKRCTMDTNWNAVPAAELEIGASH